MPDDARLAAAGPGPDVRVVRRGGWWRALRVLLAAVLFAVVLRQVDWGQFLALVRDVQPAWLVGVFLVATVDRFWMAGKWRYLLLHLGIRAPFFSALLHYYSGGLIGAAAQWQLGGDIARAVAMGRRVGRQGTVAASVVFEKVVGFAATGLWAVLAVVLLNTSWHFWPSAITLAVAGAAAVFLAALPLLASAPFVAPMLARLAPRLPWAPLRRGADQAETILRRLRQERSAILVFFFLTLAEQGVPIIVTVLLAHALGLPLAVTAIMSVVPISVFFSRLPISVEALGVREGVFVFLFGLYGVTAAGAFALALASRVMDLIAVGAGALVCAMVARRHRAEAHGAHPDPGPSAPAPPRTSATWT